MIRRKGKTASSTRADEAVSAKEEGVDAIAARYMFRDEAGALKALIPKGEGRRRDKVLDFAFLDGFDEDTATALAEGWVMWASAKPSDETRWVYWQRISHSFVRWALAQRPIPKLIDLDQDLLARFASHIGDEKSKGYVENRDLRNGYYAAIRKPLEMLKLSERWSGKLSKRTDFEDKPFESASAEKKGKAERVGDKPKTRTVIGRASYVALWDEVATTIEEAAADHRRAAEHLSSSPPKQGDIKSRRSREEVAAAMLATIKAASEPTIPATYNSLAFKPDKHRHHPEHYPAAHRLLFPRMDEVLPYLVATILFFGLNPETAYRMKLDDYRLDDVPTGGRMLRIFPDKGRSDLQRNAVAETEDESNPARFLPLLEERLRLLRRFAGEECSRNVFIYFDHSSHQVRAINQTAPPVRARLDQIAASAKIDSFQLAQLRATTMDLAHEITGGDLVAVKAIANHKSLDTSHVNYRSNGMSRRDEERLAAMEAEFERFWRSGGKVDKRSEPIKSRSLAATPGFGCLDPLQSPIPGEEDGKLCRAYGQCPICPHATVFTTSAYAYACLMAFNARLHEAMHEQHPAHYDARWGEIHKVVAFILTDEFMFADEVKETAHGIVAPFLAKLD